MPSARSVRRVLTLLPSALLMAACHSSTATTTTTSATTVTAATSATQPAPLATLVYPGGSVARAVPVATAGTLSVTLKSLTPPGTRLGIGIGVPTGGSPCLVVSSVEAVVSTTPVLAVPVDAGTYCVVAYSLQPAGGEASGFTIVITTS